MRSSLPFRDLSSPALTLAVLLGTLSSPSRAAQQPPVSSPAIVVPSTQAQQHHSQITLDNGLLTVAATNASLNGLIREIARKTGMKVSGAVAEDRVFGTYGPDVPQKVLATLLDGTGSNILILSNAADAPQQLILTPRTGAATPPDPNANLGQNDEEDDSAPPPGAPVVLSAPRARPAVQPGRVDTPVLPPEAATDRTTPSPAPEAVVFPPSDSTGNASGAPPDATTPAASSPDTPKTPQQIFEQLQRLRQQASPAGQSPQ